MKAIHLEKQSKSKFEDYLYKLNKKEALGYRKHNDFNYEENTNTILHLYYNDNGHIGTWTKGSCWIFKDYLTNTENNNV